MIALETMLVYSLALFSWIYWILWMGAFLGYELFAVRYEKSKGALPLTRVVRDRLMKRFVVVKFGVLLLLAWLFLHFTQSLSW